MTPVRFNDEAEESLLGTLLARPEAVTEVTARGLRPEHFYRRQNALLYEAIVESHYADERVDALHIAVKLQAQLASALSTDEQTAVKYVQSLAPGGAPSTRADVVRELADARRLGEELARAQAALAEGRLSVAEVAGHATEALSNAARGHDTKRPLSALDAGREFARELMAKRQMRAQGVHLGCWFDIPALDHHLQGLQGGELFILAGEPGVGKTIVAWAMALNFARRQATHPDDRRVGALIESLEMHQSPSMARLTQALTGISGTKLRTGDVGDGDMREIARGWRTLDGVPLYVDHPAKMRASQLKATINDMIERHNVGLVIVDHFRMFDLDRRLERQLEEDEEKVRFLKEDIAQSLDVAVVCLAHTRKKDTAKAADARPTLSDLRGSGQIAAHSDFTAFVFRPNKYGAEDHGHFVGVDETLAELIWEKNRHGLEGIAEFHLDPKTMTVR